MQQLLIRPDTHTASVATLPTARTFEWEDGLERLQDAVDRADDQAMANRLAHAREARLHHGAPNREWADRLVLLEAAAVQRAGRALSGSLRLAYVEVADAAHDLRDHAHDSHGVAAGNDMLAKLHNLRTQTFTRI